jgi:integrase
VTDSNGPRDPLAQAIADAKQHGLTDVRIHTLAVPGDTQREVWDNGRGHCVGLVLRISRRGRVSFHARARGPDGRKRFDWLGTWPELSLKDARTAARLRIGGMQTGADPTAAKRAARQETARQDAMPTLAALLAAWAQASARDTGARYRAEITGNVQRGCGLKAGELLTRPVDAITDADLARVIQAARARGDGEARHLVRALRRLFRFAIAVGHIENSPLETWMRREAGGRRGIPWMRDGVRERVLSDPEIAAVWAASAGLDPVARAFTRILLLSACRSGEISGLGWREVERGPAADAPDAIAALRLAATRTKNRRGHRVPLGPLAAAELRALAATAAQQSSGAAPTTGLVFPGVASRVAGICRALRSAAGIGDWSWHDARRSAATGMARLGCPREAVEAALNHISARGGLIGIYQRYDFEREAAAALLAWQAHVATLVPPDQAARAPIMRQRRAAGNVINLPTRRRGAAGRDVA